MTRATDERAGAPRAGAALALLAVFAVATTTGPFSDVTVNDLYVYRRYATCSHDGRLPYRDFGFEYPPLAVILLWLAGVPGLRRDHRAELRRAHGVCLVAASSSRRAWRR